MEKLEVSEIFKIDNDQCVKRRYTRNVVENVYIRVYRFSAKRPFHSSFFFVRLSIR